jgi:hypothetical protein
MGAADTQVVLTPTPFRGSFDFAIEGYDVTYRFDSNTATEGAHTLQAADIYVDARGNSRGNTGK